MSDMIIFRGVRYRLEDAPKRAIQPVSSPAGERSDAVREDAPRETGSDSTVKKTEKSPDVTKQ